MGSRNSHKKDDDGLGVLADSACDAGSKEPPAKAILPQLPEKSILLM
jgi:hypothetical protein